MNWKEEQIMIVAGLVLDPSSNCPIVVLKQPNSEICIPIWVGIPEAAAIASAMKGIASPRPMTHDLLKNAVELMNGKVIRVVVSSIVESTFYSIVEIEQNGIILGLDSRPSDAIALALKNAVPIFVTAEVLNEAQVKLISTPGEDGESFQFSSVNKDGDKVEPKDDDSGEKWSEILAEMDPDDFKYKM